MNPALPPMSSNRPYLLRAMFEWLVDNATVPQILVDATMAGVKVPMQFVHDGRIVLNISPSAVTHFSIENTHIEFNARFSGKPHFLYIPIRAVLAIFARDSGQGMAFSEDEHIEQDSQEDHFDEVLETKIKTTSKTKSHSAKPAPKKVSKKESKVELSSVPDKKQSSDEKSPPKKTKSKNKPQLTIVK